MSDVAKKSNPKLTIKAIALGSPGAIALMQLPIAKTALDFKFYDMRVDLYTPVLALLFLALLFATVMTAGIYLTKKTDGY